MAIGMLAPGSGPTRPAGDRRAGCHLCGQDNPAGVKFCGECGTPLRTKCQRKQVTVFFTDVCGFTGMSERLDPEDVRAIIDRAFDVILDAVHRHEGTINQFLGDGVMALFGASTAHDDHPYRAVRAALAIQEGLESLRAEVQRAHGSTFGSRSASTRPRRSRCHRRRSPYRLHRRWDHDQRRGTAPEFRPPGPDRDQRRHPRCHRGCLRLRRPRWRGHRRQGRAGPCLRRDARDRRTRGRLPALPGGGVENRSCPPGARLEP